MSEIRTVVYSVDQGPKSYPLNYSPFFQFLLNGDKEKYLAYEKMLHAQLPDVQDEQKLAQNFEPFFLSKAQLIENLEKNGYDEQMVIIVNHNNEIIDGVHRSCWLYHKRGGRHKVPVLKVWD